MTTGKLDLRAGIRARTRLLASVAGVCMIATTPAFAAPLDEDPVNRPDLVVQREAQGNEIRISDLQRDVDSQVVIGTPGTPTTAQDPVNVNGIGQMIIDQQNGFIGLCTGTLINPRTVLFAAHCVNERPANAYGADSGGQPIGFGFSNNNNQAGASAFGQWLSTYATNTDRYMYNANYVAYNPVTLEPGNEFLYGDIAIASLDTPAANVPTWSMLFSQLPDPGTITANGTGYHVDLSGYGNNGTGTTGSVGGIDFRRRVAENMIGALASIDDFESFLFGSAAGLPQNLYWIDFDDPRRFSETENPSVFDFNAWRDNATPNEGITASGDSGGPLILDQEFAKQVVIGVLSGGYTRFFNGQAPNGYGTASFYQPLYLYWDWIAANNPYHYVSAVAGDGNWSDPTHWVTTLDPGYQIIGPDGQLVNGLPGSPGSTTADEDGFGQACFQTTSSTDCVDIATGDGISNGTPIGEVGDGSATAAVTTLTGEGASSQGLITRIEGLTAQAGGGQGSQALPPATLENGLPGATNFVPNNYDGDRLTSTKPRYFDVTLAATGTTTLDSNVVIDRFTIAGGGARLNITSGGSLTSLIDVTHTAGQVNVAGTLNNAGKYSITGANARLAIAGTGTVNNLGEFHQLSGIAQVDGHLRSWGDYLLFAGGLTGNGQITAPSLTNLIGTIAPGTAGTIGTLTINGDLILTSGSALLIDVGANGTSDRVVVKSTLPPVGGVAQNGFASVGGNVAFSAVGGYMVRHGDTFTILTAEGGVLADPAVPAERFNGVPLSAILTPVFTYTDHAVQARIVAGEYGDVVSATSPVQTAYAQLLDQNRGNYNALSELFGPLDLQNAATIRATLDSLSPDGETTIRSLGIAATQSMANFFQDRVAGLETGSLGGTLAFNGNPVQLASASLGGMSNLVPDVRTDANEAVLTQENVLPETMRAYIAGGYLTGHSSPMSGSPLTLENEDYDGWFGAVGIETVIGDSGAIGLALSYTQVESDGLVGRTAEGQLYQGTLYGKIESKGGMVFDGMLSAGLFDTTTERAVTILGTGYTLTAEDNALAVTAELGMGQSFDLGTALELTPRAAFRYGHVGYSRTVEHGGAPALAYDREPVDSMQGRAGFNLNGKGTGFRPYLSAYYVHDFEDRPAVFGANFANGVGPNAIFALNGADHDWGEVSGGLTYSTGTIDISIAAETNFERSDVSSQAYRGSVTVRF